MTPRKATTPFLVSLLVATSLAAVAQVQTVAPVFTREVTRCTGGRGFAHGNVMGQDSAIAVSYGDEVRLFFGDTSVYPDGTWLPNSMATTTDLDASDGLDLEYYLPDRAMPVLLPIGEEATVWLVSVFVRGADIYAYYVSIPAGWPSVPAPGVGLAVMRDGQPPFIRTDFYAFADDPFYTTGVGPAFVQDGFVHLFGRVADGYESTVTLKRVPLDALEQRDAYEFWTTDGWSSSPDATAVLYTDAGQPSVHWSEHHQQYMAIYTVPFSPYGFLSGVALRTAPALIGPWSDATLIDGAPGTGWGSNYGASWNPVFSRENGRVIYFMSTNWSDYNVYLHETSFDFARSDMRTVRPEDFASESTRCRGVPACRLPSVGSRRLPLRREGQTITAVRLVGTSFFPSSPVTAFRLALPILPVRREPLTLTLRVSVAAPNQPPFDRRVRGDLELRSIVASTMVTVTLPVGATELVLRDEIMPLVDAAASHPDWDPGRINSVAILLTRTDSARPTVYIDTTGPMGAGQASLCYGSCDADTRDLTAPGGFAPAFSSTSPR